MSDAIYTPIQIDENLKSDEPVAEAVKPAPYLPILTLTTEEDEIIRE